VTGLIYKHDIKLLKQRLSTYLNKKRGVWILFDNLDKGWNTGGVDAIDTVVLCCVAWSKPEEKLSAIWIGAGLNYIAWFLFGMMSTSSL
jgi:hypothetical protein